MRDITAKELEDLQPIDPNGNIQELGCNIFNFGLFEGLSNHIASDHRFYDFVNTLDSTFHNNAETTEYLAKMLTKKCLAMYGKSISYDTLDMIFNKMVDGTLSV